MVIGIVLSFPLSAVGQMTSLAFLIVDAMRSGSPATWITLLETCVGAVVFEAIFRRRARS